MTPEREQQIHDLFHSALALDESERHRFVLNSCSGDDELVEEVATLLDAFERATEIFAAPISEIAASLLARESVDPLIGGRIQNYGIKSLLGRGGMGAVYLAHDERLGRMIAIKVLSTSFNEELIDRFAVEARAVSALNHPNILTIHEFGHTDTLRFIVTEFVDGQTLRNVLKGSPIENSSAVDISLQIVSALIAAHSSGIIHRDIKPENIMLRSDGNVKVLDFGIAKLTEEFGGLGSNLAEDSRGKILGTVRYMSPEQALGSEVDARSDIWSFGVVLYEMIAGSTPFNADQKSDVISQIINDQPKPLKEFRGDIRSELQNIVVKCLAKNRDERYETARELFSDLSRLRQRLDFEVANKLPETKTPFEAIFLNSSPEERKKITAFLSDLSAFTPLTEDLGAALMMQAQLSESAEIYQTMLETAEVNNDDLAKARAYNGLALVQDRKSESAAMLESAVKAEHYAGLASGSVEAQFELITSLVRQGYAHYRFGRADEMISLGERILGLADGSDDGNKRQRARGFMLIGTAHRVLGEFDRAQYYCRQAKGLYEDLGDQRSVSNSLNFSGEIARLRGDYETAILEYQKALVISRAIGEKVQQLTLLGNIGGVLVGLGDPTDGEKILREVIGLAGSEGYYGLSENYAFLAEALISQSKHEAALRIAQRALLLAKETLNQEHLGGAWRVLGVVLGRLSRSVTIDGEEITARFCFGESLSIYTSARMEAELARTLREWSLNERKLNNNAEADELGRRSIEIFTRLEMSFELERSAASSD
ncbi:MAG TPA: serine/threonine-protein kinase [Pyrinomonadaceae bacterium]|nr:serine/threonine-protein kinase [Pyrinomonadaceae bacterium]